MAETLGVAASVVAVLQVTGTVINICYNYQSGVRNAPRDLDRITNQLISLRAVLENFLTLARTEDTSGSPRLSTLSLLIEPDGLLCKCKLEVEYLRMCLEPASGWRKVGQALTWPLKEGDVKKTLNYLEQTTATLQLALTTDQTTMTLVIRDGITCIQNNMMGLRVDVAAFETDELQQKIYRWLSAPDPSSNHNEACMKRQPATGAWFIDGDAFNNWKMHPSSSLWLYGIPGSGKSILCSTVIQDVLCDRQATSSFVVAYFYFDFSDDKKQHLDNALRSLIKQLSVQCGGPCHPLDTLYSEHQNGQQQPTIGALKKVLRDILGMFQDVFIILDALDECIERQALLEWIIDVVDQNLDNLHLLVTSRKEKDIEDCLASCVSSEVNIQSTAVDPDIQVYVREQLSSNPKLKKWSMKVREEIEAVLMHGAHGMFRWVVCQLDVLQKCLKLSSLRKALNSLPKTLHETYHRILLNIEEEYRDDAFKVLQWLAFSARPVTLAEVAEVLAINLDDGPHFDPDQRLPDPRDILTICSGLVTVSPMQVQWMDRYEGVGEDTGNQHQCTGELRLAHFSVKEYLISEHIQIGGTPHFRFSKSIADAFISQICLVYLLQFKEIDSLDLRITSHFPLAHYAAEYWIFHVQSTDGTLTHMQQNLIVDLLSPQSPQFINWVRLFDCDNPRQNTYISAQSPSIPAPLYYTSLKGLEEVSQLLLLIKEVDVNAQGGRYGNALQAAAIGGHKEIVKLLLEKGAAIHVHGGYYGNALQAASTAGHKEIVMLLLEKGADINIQGGYYGNALQAASVRGHEAIVRLLLENGADINAWGGNYKNALQAASISGHEVIVRLLLEKGANINVQDGYLGNALQAASTRGHEAIVRLLLEKGADINAQGGNYENTLQAASTSGHEVIVRLLLEKGADINAQGGYYGNALQAASSGGYEAIVALLLEKGADINAQGGYFGNPLQAASTSGHKVVVRLLLQKGADVNTQGGKFGNSLQAASRKSHEAIVKLLLEKGAHANAQGGKYGNPLQAASSKGHKAIIQLLLENGADVNAEGGKYKTALQAASRKCHEATVKLLLEKGAHASTQGGKYGSPLQAASSRGHKAIIQLLLGKGADVNAQGGKYGNALQAASIGGHKETVRLLLEKEADINAQGGNYENALQAASSGGYEAIVGLLLENGADINVQGGNYENALQAASTSGHEVIVRLLLEKREDINVPDGYLENALLIASTRGHEAIVSLLLEEGANVNAQGGKFGNSLQAASRKSHEAMVKLLLEKGAHVNAQGGKYGNPLQGASSRGHKAIMQLLLEKGADVNAQGGKYGSALQAASRNSNTVIIQLLLEKGADINAQGGKFGNSLQAASRKSHKVIVKLLLEKGADVNALSGKYGNPLQAASSRGHKGIMQLLLEKGADVNAQGGKYGNALQAASKLGDMEIIQLLLEKGAGLGSHR